MSYEAYLQEFRRRTAQRVAEFEQAVKDAEASVKSIQERSDVQKNNNTPRRRGRIKGVLKPVSQY